MNVASIPIREQNVRRKIGSRVNEKASVLLVDDEKRFAEATARLLRVEGYYVEIAFSGSKALEIYQSKDRQFDIVITDLKMPVMDGIELIRHIRQIKPDQRIIVITAFSAQCAPWNRRLATDQVESDKYGFLDYLIKPFSLRQLIDVVEKALKHDGLSEVFESQDSTVMETGEKEIKENVILGGQESVSDEARKDTGETRTRASITDLSAVGAKLILEEVSRELDGSALCALVSVDGISVAEANPAGLPKQYYAGKFSLLAYLMRNTLIEIGSGDLNGFFLELGSRLIYTKFLSSGKYYICIVCEPHISWASIITAAGRAAERLQKIVG